MESTDSTSGGSQQQQQVLAQQQQPQLPPGFRFHPTDEELVVHYLKRKAASVPLPVSIIADVDLYKFDPWELPGKATFGEQEWYFFSPRDRKYPNGARPNRAATSGYWKATGTDKPILSSIDAGGGHKKKVGVKKALVFYGGKPPKGIKTNWIMHEYRIADSSTNTKPPHLQPPPPASTAHHIMSSANGRKTSLRLDDWVLCRIYKKNNSSSSNSSCMQRQLGEYEGNGDHCVSMDNELSVSTEQGSMFHLQATATTISRPQGRMHQHQHQHQNQRFVAGHAATAAAATATYYSSALLDNINEDTFFQGFMSNNSEQQEHEDGVNTSHTNSKTCNTTIQLAGSPANINIAAAVTDMSCDGGNMSFSLSNREHPHDQRQNCSANPAFQSMQAPANYWCNAAAVVGNANPQPLPLIQRFQAYNSNDDSNSYSSGSIDSNSNKTTNTNKTSNNTSSNNNNGTSGTNSNSADHADDDGHTIQTMLHPQSSTIASIDYHQHLLLGSLGDGTNPTLFQQVPYKLLSTMNWRSST